MKSITRETRETRVKISLGEAPRIDTGLPFFDHMLTAFSTYAALPLLIEARGDLHHHLMEDVALTVGAFVRKKTPATCARYGEQTIPMDDVLVQAVIDLSGRPYFRGKLPNRLYTHWFRSFATAAEATLHLRVLAGVDRHHMIEASFKALGLALRAALREGEGRVFSTKGSVRWTEEP
jgi:imidazoleglycerol-phosphate dehydratase